MKKNVIFTFLVIAVVVSGFYMDNKQAFHDFFNKMSNNQQVSLKKGGKGPGSGIIFYMEGGKAWEVSEWLEKDNWEEAKKRCSTYRGGGFSDWYLPNMEELNWVYENLVKTGVIKDTNWYWSSSPLPEFDFA